MWIKFQNTKKTVCSYIYIYIYFWNSLIIHEEKTKKINSVKEFWMCDPNYQFKFKFSELLLWFSPWIVNALRSYIKHSKECFIRYPNTSIRSWLKKTRLRLGFSTHFSLFGYLMKHSSSCLTYNITNCRQYCFGLLGLISAVLMCLISAVLISGMSVSL